MAQRCVSRVALLGTVIALGCVLGCGSTAATIPATSSPNISGNWNIIGTLPSGSGLASPVASFSGALQSSNGTVTGTLHAFDSTLAAPCVSLLQDLPATGTIDAANDLTLNVAIGGGAALIQVALTQDLQTFASGTYSIAGGACAMPSTPMRAIQIPPVTGTYTGTFTLYQSSPAITATVTAQLTQSSTPNPDGNFSLSGMVTIAGTTCPATFAFADELVSGPVIEPPPPTGSQTGSLNGGVLPPLPPSTAWSILGSVGSFTTNCSPYAPIWSGTLTPQ